jgi:hypothetical protein
MWGYYMYVYTYVYTYVRTCVCVCVCIHSTQVVLNAGKVNLCTIKSKFINLIHQADLQINGKTIESTQPFINVARHFQLISEMSVNDLATLGHTIGVSPILDNPRAVKNDSNYHATAASDGNGLSNNRPYKGSSEFSSTLAGGQNAPATYIALQHKISRSLIPLLQVRLEIMFYVHY